MSCDISNYKVDEWDVDEYGLQDDFRKIITAFVKKIVKSGNWFGFCKLASDDQVDIMKMENDEGKRLGELIGSKYYPDTAEVAYRSAIYKAFMASYLCYYEVPARKQSFVGDKGFYTGYNKFLATSNILVIAWWLDITVNEALNLYGDYFEALYIDDGETTIPYVRLVIGKDGKRKVRKPRMVLDIGAKGTRVIPLFALKEGMDLLYSASTKVVNRVSFIKDSGEVRDMDISFNNKIIRDIYGESDFYFKAFDGCYTGDFLSTSEIEYGYIKAIEVGGSRYDNPLRSLNFSRITKVVYQVEPNLTYVNIDIDSAVDSFKEAIRGRVKKSIRVARLLCEFRLMDSEKANAIKGDFDLESWVDSARLMGTVFLRSLAMFMLGNPEEFPNYTGEPVSNYSDSGEKTLKKVGNGDVGLVEE